MGNKTLLKTRRGWKTAEIFHASARGVGSGRRGLNLGPDSGPLMPTAERSIGLNLYSDRGVMRHRRDHSRESGRGSASRPGAPVTRIEGKPATNWTHDQVDQWIASHAIMALVVAGSVGEHALTLRVWDLVPWRAASRCLSAWRRLSSSASSQRRCAQVRLAIGGDWRVVETQNPLPGGPEAGLGLKSRTG